MYEKAHGLVQQYYVQAIKLVEAACGTWQTFLDDYAFVSSVRGDDHFQTMRTSLRPYRQNRAVRDLDERVRTVAQQRVPPKSGQ
ncbi:hypothetical protein [Streptacidiphilus sp. PAMC 29251]